MEQIEITNGVNGYPQNLHKGYIGFDNLDEAIKFAEENNGRVVVLHRKDGWNLWESEGRATGLLENRAENFGDYFHAWDSLNDWEDYCREIIGGMVADKFELSEIQDKLNELMVVGEQIDFMNEGEIAITCDNQFYEILPKFAMSISYDTHNYEIGVEC